MEAEPILGFRIHAADRESMHRFSRGAAKGIHYPATRLRVEVFHPVPIDSVRSTGDVIKISFADQRSQLRLVELKFLFRDFVVLCMPSRGIDHQAKPAHHAASQHIAEILKRRKLLGWRT